MARHRTDERLVRDCIPAERDGFGVPSGHVARDAIEHFKRMKEQ